MQIAIVGLAASGKTTVFNTLTRGHAETGGFGGLQLNVGVVKVPDERLDRLAEIFKPKKIVHADVTYVDLPAPPASTEGRIGTEELPAEHLARLRDSDALLHVVRAFEDPSVPHPLGNVDPWRDLEHLDLEFIMADLAITDRRLERLAATGRHGTPAEREANEREEVILRRLKAALEEGRPIRDEPLEPEEEKAIRGFRFLTQKPVLVLLNLGEKDLPNAAARVAAIAERYTFRHAIVDSLSARIEMELGELDADDLAAFMAELGLHGSSLDRVIALSYRLARAHQLPHGRSGRGPRVAGPERLDGGGRRGRDPHRPRPRVHPRRGGGVRGPPHAGLDRRGAQARQAALRGQDLPGPRRGRAGDPLQPLIGEGSRAKAPR